MTNIEKSYKSECCNAETKIIGRNKIILICTKCKQILKIWGEVKHAKNIL